MTASLLTWLWQGVALAVVLSIALHLLPRVNAATRYMLWWGAFAALIALGWQALPVAHANDLPGIQCDLPMSVVYEYEIVSRAVHLRELDLHGRTT